MAESEMATKAKPARRSRLSVQAAAKAGRCSETTIRHLVKAGKLPGERRSDSPKAHWRVLASRATVRSVVAAESPTSGWTKNGHGKAAGRPRAEPRLRAAPAAGRMREVLAWLAVPAGKRPALLKLAARCSAEDLELLLTL